MCRRERVLSLKDFHVVFISSAVLCCLGLSYWALRHCQMGEGGGYCLSSLLSLLIAVGLVIYEIYFIRKIKA
jgi:hypothetical protein